MEGVNVPSDSTSASQPRSASHTCSAAEVTPREAEDILNSSFVTCEWSDCEGGQQALVSACNAEDVRRSPRTRKKKTPFDPSFDCQLETHAPRRLNLSSPSTVTSCTASRPWNLFDVTEMDGCVKKCVRTVHGLSEYDILNAHGNFSSKTATQQRQWMFDYLTTHCPTGDDGRKDLKSITFVLCGKTVCCSVWLAALSISSSRFYEVRKMFADGTSVPTPKRPRSVSVKTHEAIAWMTNYFERVGDKRPDKDGIYLPTCLTERAIHNHMVEELYLGDQSQAICFSQFNRLFRTSFPNVTIPKVSSPNLCIYCYSSKVF